MDREGEGMHVYEQDVRGPARHGAVSQRDADGVTGVAARRAAEAGSARHVEPAAVVRLQRMVGNSGVVSLMEQENEQRSPVLDVVGRGGGSPLPGDVRSEMEAGLGSDFGDVRVHEGDAAASSAQAVGAKAYTVGNEIVFNEGAYEPQTDAGRHTLAHELTHVVQQRSGPVEGTPTGDGVAVSHPDDRFEREAEASAAALVGAGTPAQTTTAGDTAAPGVQRQADADEETEELQTTALQRQEENLEEEDDLSAQTTPLQREVEEEEEPVPQS